MSEMYIDKGGASAVFGTFAGVVNLKLKKNVTMVVPLAENGIGPNAYKPSEILTSLKGSTVEVLNTDAEGRLILADAMTYVQKNFSCKKMIELSTLTGAAMVALGKKTAGIFSNDKSFSESLLSSSRSRNFIFDIFLIF
jgi:leucyl aminopeptidase